MGLETVSALLQTYPIDSDIIWIDAHPDMNTLVSLDVTKLNLELAKDGNGH